MQQALTYQSLSLRLKPLPNVLFPICKGLSSRVHSRYERTLQDLTLARYSITLQLQVRKFFCINPACLRRIFIERLPEVTVPWARRTNRLADALTAIALALGGAAGARIGRQLPQPPTRCATRFKLLQQVRVSSS